MDVSKSRGCQHRNTGRSLPSGIAPTTPRDERTTGAISSRSGSLLRVKNNNVRRLRYCRADLQRRRSEARTLKPMVPQHALDLKSGCVGRSTPVVDTCHSCEVEKAKSCSEKTATGFGPTQDLAFSACPKSCRPKLRKGQVLPHKAAKDLGKWEVEAGKRTGCSTTPH